MLNSVELSGNVSEQSSGMRTRQGQYDVLVLVERAKLKRRAGFTRGPLGQRAGAPRLRSAQYFPILNVSAMFGAIK